jgi:hypothetical protein
MSQSFGRASPATSNGPLDTQYSKRLVQVEMNLRVVLESGFRARSLREPLLQIRSTLSGRAGLRHTLDPLEDLLAGKRFLASLFN